MSVNQQNREEKVEKREGMLTPIDAPKNSAKEYGAGIANGSRASAGAVSGIGSEERIRRRATCISEAEG